MRHFKMMRTPQLQIHATALSKMLKDRRPKPTQLENIKNIDDTNFCTLLARATTIPYCAYYFDGFYKKKAIYELAKSENSVQWFLKSDVEWNEIRERQLSMHEHIRSNTNQDPDIHHDDIQHYLKLIQKNLTLIELFYLDTDNDDKETLEKLERAIKIQILVLKDQLSDHVLNNFFLDKKYDKEKTQHIWQTVFSIVDTLRYSTVLSVSLQSNLYLNKLII